MGPEQLYLLPPEAFTAARDEAAKAAKADGDADRSKQLKALRRPSVAAWLVNVLVAEQPDLVEQLLALGPALAEAQSQGQGDELRALGAQRRDLVGAVVRQAVELGDRGVTAAVRDEVASTLETALADAEAAEAVRSGRLVRSLSYAGFGGVDLEGAVARTSAAPRPTKQPGKAEDDKRVEQIAVAEAAALLSAGRLDDLVRTCQAAEQEQVAAQQRAARLHQEIERLQVQLADVAAAARAADHERLTAEKASDRAVGAVRRAQRVEEVARAELDRLRRER